MNWDAIGAVGEITGASAVVVSLVYLALQIRHASKTTQIQIEQAEAASIIGPQSILIDNPELGLDVTPGAPNIRDELHMKKVAFWFS